MLPETAEQLYSDAIEAAIRAGARWAVIEVTHVAHPHTDGYFEGMDASSNTTETMPDLPLLPSDQQVEPGLYAALLTPAAMELMDRTGRRTVNSRFAYTISAIDLHAGRIVLIGTFAEPAIIADDIEQMQRDWYEARLREFYSRPLV